MLSIIMPVYNTAAYLEETVRSVLAQTYKDLELILVDDGSTDGSGALCDALTQTDSRIRVVHKPNGGVASARNVGVDHVRGEYIGFVDSDDIISPVMFELLLEQAQKYDAQLVQCFHVRETDKLVLQKTAVEAEVLNNIESLKRIYRSHYTNALSLCTKLLKTSLFDGLRFTEGTAFEDDEVVPILLERSEKSVFIELPLYCYVKRENSIITAPKVKNIQALTGHLENRTLRYRELDESLYKLGLEHFFRYLRWKTFEDVFRSTPVQTQVVALQKKHYKEFRRIANRYDRVGLFLLRCGKWGLRIVVKTNYEPLQSLFRWIRRLLRLD